MIGEPGLLIGQVANPAMYAEGFYLGGKAVNEKKYVRNAFVDGDAFFNYGDLLYIDKDYFLYFKDRVGDTFRSACTKFCPKLNKSCSSQMESL